MSQFQFPNLRRVLLISKRDYLGYVKTIGFWISFLLPLVLIMIGFLLSTFNVKEKLAPVRYEAILDITGQYGDEIRIEYENEQRQSQRKSLDRINKKLSPEDKKALLESFDNDGVDGVSSFIQNLGSYENSQDFAEDLTFASPKLVLVDAPSDNLEDIKPYLRGEKFINVDGVKRALDGLMFISKNEQTGRISAAYWSGNVQAQELLNMTQSFFSEKAAQSYLAKGGLNLEEFNKARKGTHNIATFNPNKSTKSGAGQAVTIADRLPYFIAGGMTMLLWLSIFSGSYMLLTSMLEEKLNKLLETMLSSVQFSEVMLGKLIGIAALTLTSMFPYFALASLGLFGLTQMGDVQIAQGVQNALTPQIFGFFALYMILGYVFYGALFIAIGSLANSMQDAQTMTTPLLLLLTSCVMIVPIGLSSPDAALVKWASWFPFSAPFATIIRLPSNPPLWELILPAIIVLSLTITILLLGGRAFRFGVFGSFSVKSLFKRKLRHD